MFASKNISCSEDPVHIVRALSFWSAQYATSCFFLTRVCTRNSSLLLYQMDSGADGAVAAAVAATPGAGPDGNQEQSCPDLDPHEVCHSRISSVVQFYIILPFFLVSAPHKNEKNSVLFRIIFVATAALRTRFRVLVVQGCVGAICFPVLDF